MIRINTETFASNPKKWESINSKKGLGNGAWSSVFSTGDPNIVLKRVNRLHYDPWLPYAANCMITDTKETWMPKVYNLVIDFKAQNAYAIMETLISTGARAQPDDSRYPGLEIHDDPDTIYKKCMTFIAKTVMAELPWLDVQADMHAANIMKRQFKNNRHQWVVSDPLHSIKKRGCRRTIDFRDNLESLAAKSDGKITIIRSTGKIANI